MELGIKQLVTVVLTLLVSVSLLGFVETINEKVNGSMEAQISNFTSNYGVQENNPELNG